MYLKPNFFLVLSKSSFKNYSYDMYYASRKTISPPQIFKNFWLENRSLNLNIELLSPQVEATYFYKNNKFDKMQQCV